ncbi:hypothetical protein TURU_052680 [Turdus rufiventris]|nr:hypothetical protein TURU_052680 [Turdus rufiventris]
MVSSILEGKVPSHASAIVPSYQKQLSFTYNDPSLGVSESPVKNKSMVLASFEQTWQKFKYLTEPLENPLWMLDRWQESESKVRITDRKLSTSSESLLCAETPGISDFRDGSRKGQPAFEDIAKAGGERGKKENPTPG